MAWIAERRPSRPALAGFLASGTLLPASVPGGSGRFGLVHAPIRGCQDGLERSVSVPGGDADTEVGPRSPPGCESGGDVGRLFRPRLGQQDHELVPTCTDRDVAAPDAALNQVGDPLQRTVTSVVAGGVVQLLQLVYVDDDDAVDAAGAQGQA